MKQLNVVNQETAASLGKYVNAKIAPDTINYTKDNPNVRPRDAAPKSNVVKKEIVVMEDKFASARIAPHTEDK